MIMVTNVRNTIKFNQNIYECPFNTTKYKLNKTIK